MRLNVSLLLTFCTLTACVSAQPPSVAIVGAQSTLDVAAVQQAATWQARQDADATQRAAPVATAEHWRQVTATAQAVSAQSTGQARATGDSLGATATWYSLQSTAIQATRAALEIQAEATQAENDATLQRGLYWARATAEQERLDEERRYERGMNNVYMLVVASVGLVLPYMLAAGATMAVRYGTHRIRIAELRLMAVTELAPALAEPPKPQQIAPRASPLKYNALKWVADSIIEKGADATQLVGWQGATSDAVRTALMVAGLVQVEPGVGTFARDGLRRLMADVEALGDDLKRREMR